MIATCARARTASAPLGVLRTYSTVFPLTENPMSESANWVNGGTLGVDWSNMRTTPGKCWGLQGSGSFRDGTALLTGTWANNQSAQGTVFSNSPPDTNFPEVELRLRSAITANVNRGYEVSFSTIVGTDPYLIIVRWNGPFGAEGVGFDYLLNVHGPQYSVGTGDVVRATISGTTINAYKNSTLMGTADITALGGTVWTSGAPGLGHNSEEIGGAHNDLYGFSDYTASDL